MAESFRKVLTKIAVIGTGRLGTSLGLALVRAGFGISGLSDRRLDSAQESRRIIGQGHAGTDSLAAAAGAGVIFITVPDDAIRDAAETLASAKLDLSGRFVYHCSGLLSSKELFSLKAAGASVASAHPVQSFPIKASDPAAFRDIAFGLEGNDQALALARFWVKALGGREFVLKPGDKALYHTACTLASNFLSLLPEMGAYLLVSLGMTVEAAREILAPLVQGTLHNINKLDRYEAMSGPLTRGDIQTVRAHLKALEAFPAIRRTYRLLAAQVLERGTSIEVSGDKGIMTLKDLLEEK